MADSIAPTPPAATEAGGRRRWPLLLIGASAGTATWSGWVGLGELTGFGVVHPLPGIWDDLTINSAITLPIGVEAYAVYALSVATDPRTRTPYVRRWAWGSAFGALVLGMAGQVTYHLLTPNARPGTPGWVVALVSCLPVLVLGAASLLWHLTGQDHLVLALADPTVATTTPNGHTPPTQLDIAGVSVPGEEQNPRADEDQRSPENPVPNAAAIPQDRRTASEDRSAAATSGPATRQPAGNGPASEVTTDDAAIVAAIIATGTVPSVRQIKADHRVGGSRAVRIRALAVGALAVRPDGSATAASNPESGSASAVSGQARAMNLESVDGLSVAPSGAGATERARAARRREQTSRTTADVSPLQAEIEEFLQQIERPEHTGE